MSIFEQIKIKINFFTFERRVITYDTNTGICTLTIKNLTIDDDGEYKCTAKNVAGEASLTINIQRNAPGQSKRFDSFTSSSSFFFPSSHLSSSTLLAHQESQK